ncbi:hypothetical protein GYMLUDRAFT_40287 [Collybiopsis luxurians FD-317 M1]|uniref:PH domain-containing protein n=1 Tax=Collybiopsis luxurians FD-317 M1 TaxID=944289 RepID=A0A0D0CM03_9AGAR|nr:hypothetical protein GYMLUDRAFT_40287 [Collybiopsis luxurians FD-317 M1]
MASGFSQSPSLAPENTPTPMSASALKQVKLLAALRSGDPALIHPFLVEIGKERKDRARKSLQMSNGEGEPRKEGEDDDLDTGAAALHLAIRCASIDTIRLLLSHRSISPNGIHPPNSGTTPLHLAASLGRAEVVEVLLEQEGIDDTRRDRQGRKIEDVAKGKEVSRVIRDSRTFLNASYRSLLHSYILSSSNPASPTTSPLSPPEALLSLLSSPRVSYINLSYLDPTSGTSLLHEAAKHKDIRLCELVLKAGGDVFVRDNRGRAVFDKAYVGEGGGKGGKGGNGNVGVFLRQFANHDTTLINQLTQSHQTEAQPPPALKGYLNKYTNVAKGYNTRWFVLKGGVLSYYRHEEDETVASRGSISMKAAILRISASDKLRFEVHSTPAKGHTNIQKWYMKANHPVEAARWTQAISKSLEWYSRQAQRQITLDSGREGGGTGYASGTEGEGFSRSQSSSSMSSTNLLGPSLSMTRTTQSRSSKASVASIESDSNSGHSINAGITPHQSTAPGQPAPSTHSNVSRSSISSSLSGLKLRKKSHRKDTQGSTSSLNVEDDASRTGGRPDASPLMNGESDVDETFSRPQSRRGKDRDDGVEADDDDDESEEEASSENSSLDIPGKGKVPHADTYELSGNSMVAQIELMEQLLGAASTSSSSSPALQSFIDSAHTLKSLVTEYMSMSSDRETYYRRRLASARKAQKAWEESIKVVVKEGESLEQELRKRSRKRGSKFFDTVHVGGLGTITGPTRSGSAGSVGQWDTNATLRAKQRPVALEDVQEVVPGVVPVTEDDVKTPMAADGGPTPTASTILSVPVTGTRPPLRVPGRSETMETLTPTALIPRNQPGGDYGDDDEDEDEEDEFFDAIESNNIPNLVIPEQLAVASPTATVHSIHSVPHPHDGSSASSFTAVDDESRSSKEALSLLASFNGPAYTGYASLRAKLTLAADRPATSLWSVLKNSIGKDLTKISFPVYFNEPTSMLQRMAEDMEFSECLDVAAREHDPLRRIAFVAAFAMSNYSSTIGRIAKPFNPMLGETFEYVRLDKQYRYVSEQVSHHPPISACWAESFGMLGDSSSPAWKYYGEVDAQNKFMGKSFEIRPTGVAHAELKIPSEWVGGKGAKAGTGKGDMVMEHYSWKKVTTSVSGFILGSPTIDHYGDMIVTNHRTKDQCILTFKPRGWRGKDAYEISGEVTDASGNVAYEIAGRWNSQLIARQVIGGSRGFGMLSPDTSVNTSGPTSPSSPAHVLLWRNTEKPSGSPFNLTPFALTLNDCPKDTLKPYIAPTDCRLRPDQRAFELGLYDLANELKGKQEDKQRATRKKRETGELAPHRPRWFSAETDGDTGERVWAPAIGKNGGLEYWEEREKAWKDISMTGKGTWKDMEHIFIDEPAAIR